MLLKLLLKVMDIIIKPVGKLKSLLNSDLAIFLLNFTLHIYIILLKMYWVFTILSFNVKVNALN